MMMMRILISQTHIESSKYKILRRYIYFIVSIIFIFIINYYIKLNLYPPGKPQPVDFTQKVDLVKKRSLITVKSLDKTGKITFFLEDIKYTINNNCSRTIESAPELLTIEKEESAFLDRKNLILKIKGEGNPEKFIITLLTKETPVILDCNYPWTIDLKEKKGVIHIGKNPPSPLIIDLLIPSDIPVWVDIKVIYTDIPFDYKLSGENIIFTKIIEVNKGIDG